MRTQAALSAVGSGLDGEIGIFMYFIRLNAQPGWITLRMLNTLLVILYKTAWKDLIENCGEYAETSDDIQIERIGSYRREKYDNRIG